MSKNEGKLDNFPLTYQTRCKLYGIVNKSSEEKKVSQSMMYSKCHSAMCLENGYVLECFIAWAVHANLVRPLSLSAV